MFDDDQKIAINILLIVSIILLSIYAIVLGRYGNDEKYDLNLIIVVLLIIVIIICFFIIYQSIMVALSKFRDKIEIKNLKDNIIELKRLKEKEVE